MALAGAICAAVRIPVWFFRWLGAVRTFNVLGLTLTLIGVVMVARYGIPPVNRTGGAMSLGLEGINEAERQREDWYDMLTERGLWLIIGGTAMQLIAIIVDARQAHRRT